MVVAKGVRVVRVERRVWRIGGQLMGVVKETARTGVFRHFGECLLAGYHCREVMRRRMKLVWTMDGGYCAVG
jgi:hypothetical protein